MRFKFEVFKKFKEFRCETEKQTKKLLKILRSDRGGEHLNVEFLSYLKKNNIISQWTLPEMPQLNEILEQRN